METTPLQNRAGAPLHTYVPDWPPELSIVPAQPLAAVDRDGEVIAELDPGRGGKALVEPLSTFKRALDRRLNARARPGAAADSWLLGHGFVKEPSGRGVSGNTFINWLFGPFWRPSQETDLCRVPAWACIGWNRRQRPALAAEAALAVARELDDQTRRGDTERAIGHWFAPFPLVLMGEGQHRVDLYGAHGLPLLVQLRIATLAPAASLRLQRVLGCDDLLALHCLEPRFCGRGESTALLPFPALTVPLLEAYGVRWARGRHVVTPCSRALRDAGEHPSNDPTRGWRRWRPRVWRQLLLSQCYV
jgi:hypothetical protein